MAIVLQNTYEIGVNNDLGNLANNVDRNRVGEDTTFLEVNSNVTQVAVGSLVESNGSLYAVTDVPFTPAGIAEAGAYLFFDDTVPGFVWSTTPGTYDAARGGIYDASNRRQCKWVAFTAQTFSEVDDQGLINVPTGSFLSVQAADTGVPINSSAGRCQLDRNGLIFDVNATNLRVLKWDGSTLSITASIVELFPSTSIAVWMSPNRVAVIDPTAPTIAMVEATELSISQVGNTFVDGAPQAINVAVRVDDNTIVAFFSGSTLIKTYVFDGTNWSLNSQNPTGLPSAFIPVSGFVFGSCDNRIVYGSLQTNVLNAFLISINKGTSVATTIDSFQYDYNFTDIVDSEANTNRQFIDNTSMLIITRNAADPTPVFSQLIRHDGRHLRIVEGPLDIGSKALLDIQEEFTVINDQNGFLTLISRDPSTTNGLIKYYGLSQSKMRFEI